MGKSTIKFTRTREVSLPLRGHANDAGIDFFVPTFDSDFIKDLKLKNPDLFLTDINNSLVKFDDAEGLNYIPLSSLSRINIPSGVYCQMEEAGRALIAHNKSGVASKLGLLVGACVDGDTMIETNKGIFTAKTLTKDFIRYNEILINGYDELKKEYGFYEFDGFRVSGEKESIKFIFEDKSELICSEDHLLLTDSGWKMAKDIDSKDNLIQ
jgi:hypothetical protein